MMNEERSYRPWQRSIGGFQHSRAGSSTPQSDSALGGLCSLSAIVGPLEGFVKPLTSLPVVESEYSSRTVEMCLGLVI